MFLIVPILNVALKPIYNTKYYYVKPIVFILLEVFLFMKLSFANNIIFQKKYLKLIMRDNKIQKGSCCHTLLIDFYKYQNMKVLAQRITF